MSVAVPLRRTAASVVAGLLLAIGLPALGGVAHASHDIVDVNPKGSVNNVTTLVEVIGSGFQALPTTSVYLRRVGAPGDVIPGTLNVPLSNSNTLRVTFNFTHMNPGLYDVVVAQPDPVVASEDVLLNAFTVTASGPPSVTAVQPGGAKGDLTIRGTNFTRGSIVTFWVGAVQDTAITFVRNGGTQDVTTINGTYTYTAGVLAGPHTVRVTHTDNSSFGQCAVCFSQPKIANLSVTALGQGATNKQILVNGDGLTGGVASVSGSGVTVLSQSVVNDDQISMQVSVSPSATTGARTVTVSHPSGGYHDLVNGLTITASPTVSSVSPSSRGQGAQSQTLTLTGSGFQGGMTVAFNPSVGITTNSVTVVNSTTTQVVVTLAENAATGSRDVIVTNPDFGSSTLAGGFTVNNGPKVTKVNPSSLNPGQTSTVTVEGSNFSTTSITLDFGPGITATVNSVNLTGTLITATVTVAPSAPTGLRTVVATNTGDQGRGSCVGCFGIDSIDVVGPAASQNNTTATISVFKPSGGFDMSSQVTMVRDGAVDGQGPITGTVTAVNGPTTILTFTANLDHQAPGPYNIQVVTGSVNDACIDCYTILGGVPTVTSAAPSAGSRGAQNLLVSLTGTNFANGDTITLTRAGGIADPNLQVVPGSVNVLSLTSLNFRMNIAPGTTTGPIRISVTDTTEPTPQAGFCECFTVVEPPTISGVSPASRGQNSDPVNVTITGQGFESGATVDFGAGVVEGSPTVTEGGLNPDTISVTVNVEPDATPGTRNVTVTNTNGGTATCNACFTVKAKPVITSISPSSGAPNTFTDVTINGSGFTNNMTLSAAPDITVSNFAFVSPAQVTARFTIAANPALGPLDVSAVNNAVDDGGRGGGENVFTIITIPGKPTAVTATAGNQSATVSWTAPSSDGGSDITSYNVTCSPSCGTQSVDGGTTALAVTGLTNGTVYKFQVRAVNAVGQGLPSDFSNSVLPLGPDGDFVPVNPSRIKDTRTPVSSPVGPSGTLAVQVTGTGGVPLTGVTAVVANVTAVAPTGGGNLRVFPTGVPVPNASTLNFGTGQTVPNLVKVKIGTGGQISIHNASSGSTHVLVDVVGYFVDGNDDPEQRLTSISPERLFDTRNGAAPDAPLLGVSNGPNASRTFTIADGSPVPADATAVVLNVTVVSPTAGGFLTVFPAGQPRPTVSNLNFAKGQTVPNLVVVKLGTGGSDAGKLTFFNGSAGNTNVFADAVGYYKPTGAKFKPLTPVRIMDTRNTTPLVGTVNRSLTVLGVGGVPNSSTVKAVVVNVTVVSPTAGGFLTVYPSLESRPTASNLNFVRGSTIANLVVVKVGTDGKIVFFNGSSGSTNVLADVVGYYI